MSERSTTPQRLALYARVSKDLPGSRSVDDQLADGRAWAERHGHVIVGEFRDDGVSASAYARQARTDWPRLVEQLTAGAIDVLWTWEVSRTTRDRAVWAALLAACVERGVLLAERDRVFDPADPDDAFNLDLQQILGVREVAKLRSRIKRAARHRRARGEPHGRLIDGLMIEYDPATGRPLRRVLDPVRAPIIREIAGRFLAGESAYAIAKDLNRREITTIGGKTWRGENVTRHITSPTLAGLIENDGVLVPAKWPAIITAEQHARIVAMMAESSARLGQRDRETRYLLTTIATCGVCSAPLRSILRRRTNGTQAATYACPDRFCVSRLIEPVDAFVSAAAVRFLSRPDVAAELSDGDQDDERAAARARAAELTAELVKARTMHRAGRLSLESLSHLESWALPEVAECERRARPAGVPSVVLDVAGADAAARWDATSIVGRRTIMRTLFTVTLHKATSRGRGFDPSTVEITRRVR